MSDEHQTTIIPPRRAREPMRIRNLGARLPERGKIKIGMKAALRTSSQGNEFQPPQKLDHFRVTTLDRGKDGNFLIDEDFHNAHGPEPKEIPIRLLYDEVDLNFPTRYACFLGRTLWCTGNGEVATRISDSPPRNRSEIEQLKPKPREVECTCFRQEPSYDGRDKCKPNGALGCIIDGHSGLGGVWTFRTTSYNSIVGILSSLEFMRQITGGILANIPLKLRIMPKQATNPTNGTQVMIYVVGLEFAGDVPQLQQYGHQIALDRARTHVSIANIEQEARRMLALPGLNAVLPGDNVDDVIDEFYADEVSMAAADVAEEPAQEAQQEAATEPVYDDQPLFAVVDEVGEIVLETTDADEAKNHLESVLDQAAKSDRKTAWENNAGLISELIAHDHIELAQAATSAYEERLTKESEQPTAVVDASAPVHAESGKEDVFGLRPLPEENAKSAAPAAPANTQDKLRQHLGTAPESFAVPLRKAVGQPCDWNGTGNDMIAKIETIIDLEALKAFERDNAGNLDLMKEGMRAKWSAVKMRIKNRHAEITGNPGTLV